MYGEDDVKKTTLAGTIQKAALGGLSKSAHTGFVLHTNEAQIKLRRDGASPFYDNYFEPYENMLVKVDGYDMQEYFLVTALRQQTTSRKK